MKYKKQALDFCKKYGVEILIKRSSYQSPPNWANEDNGTYGIKYDITIIRNEKKYKFNFWDSIINKQDYKDPSEYSILSCLTKYDPESFSDFCGEFGYEEYCDNCDSPNRKSYKIYKQVVKEWENVNRLFSDCLDELSEIQ